MREIKTLLNDVISIFHRNYQSLSTRLAIMTQYFFHIFVDSLWFLTPSTLNIVELEYQLCLGLHDTFPANFSTLFVGRRMGIFLWLFYEVRNLSTWFQVAIDTILFSHYNQLPVSTPRFLGLLAYFNLMIFWHLCFVATPTTRFLLDNVWFCEATIFHDMIILRG